MQGSFLRFYVHESDRVHGRPAWEWLLDQANRLGIRGGSAFKAMAGFGRHHVLHESTFFELAGSLTVEVEFIVTDDETQRLLDLVRREKLRMFYARIPAQFGVLETPATDQGLTMSHDHDHKGKHSHVHGHEHTHSHSHAHEHEHRHGDLVHSHPHQHAHSHSHEHRHDHEHDAAAHEHGEELHFVPVAEHRHGGHEHQDLDAEAHKREPHDHDH